MDTKTVIMDTLNHLIDTDYRAGFSDSVLHKVCEAVGETNKGNLWAYVCCGHWNKVVAEYFDGDILVKELWDEAERVSKLEGCFVMPWWGTNGT